MNDYESFDGKNAMIEEQAGSRSAGGKYLTFRLANEEYGLQILKVREINGIMNITAVPRMPNFMKGVINLRGKVIPVISLRSKFELPEKDYTEQTCIIVVDVGREIGILVDTVSEVLDISSDSVDPPPALSQSVDSTFILGLGKVGDDIKILLDIDRILGEHELHEITDLATTSSEPGAA
jgi:purine-binding chemotaxis protein CheW